MHMNSWVRVERIENDVKLDDYRRYLAKSKSTAAITSSFEYDDDASPASRRTSLISSALRCNTGSGNPSRYGVSQASSSSVSRKPCGRLGRSKSSHELLLGETSVVGDYDDDGPTMTTASAARGYYRGTGSTGNSYDDDDDGYDEVVSGSTSSISSWARYLKNKYGYKGPSSSSKDTTMTASASKTPLGSSRSCGALYKTREASFESTDDESGEKSGPTSLYDSTRRQSTVSHSPGYAGTTSGVLDGGGHGGGQQQRRRRGTGGGGGGGVDNRRSSYLQKRRLLMKIGVRGSEPSCFTWPRGIAVGPDNSIVVADSSNHRVQLFDDQGNFRNEFGTYGSAEGEFDCLAGVAINRIGQFIVSDRYNHRLQIFDPSGRFLRAFGSQGSVDGKLSYPWGLATDSLGFIYVCDKENHRVQVFQSDGTFVGKFGSLGSRPGQLEHPHYVAVSNTNRVVVSDSNNHRVQIFDVNGKVIGSFGSEGSDEGQFKFPRGVAVDDQGYVIVGDSGNNRVQIFTPDGTFLRAFGNWGSGDGEFKGLEGVAVSSNGEILVCDRENHRIQVF